MKTIKAIATGLIALVCISQADAQDVVKKKHAFKAGVPDVVTDSFKVVKHKPKEEGISKMKTKSYSGYYDYYGDRFYWDPVERLYFTVDKNGNRTYYEKRFQPY